MRGRLLSLLVLLGLGAASPASAQVVRLGQPNAARFPQVSLYAYPIDARGLLMAGLTESEFVITENGAPAEDVLVESEGGTLDVCLALDRSLSMRDERKMDHARLAARGFVEQLGPLDRAAIVTFGNGCTLDAPLTRDRRPALAAIGAAQPNGDETHFLDGVFWAVQQVALEPLESRSVLGAAQGRAESRRVVVAVTDGLDNGSHVFMPRLLEFARANGVSLCMVALGNDAATPQMQSLAEETGGVYLRAPGPHDLERLYVALAEQLRREYRITYRTPRPEADATRREVRVTLAQSPLYADGWYQAPGQGSVLVTVPLAGESGPAATTAVGEGEPGTQLATGLMLLFAGLCAVVGAFFYWLGARDRRLPIRDSNPRLDLMPLWVREGSTRVGRAGDCEVVLSSSLVSQVHARIVAVNGVFHVFDEGSRNGTYVNGRRVYRSRKLRPGDVVRFADQAFRFAGARDYSGP